MKALQPKSNNRAARRKGKPMQNISPAQRKWRDEENRKGLRREADLRFRVKVEARRKVKEEKKKNELEKSK